MINHLSAPAPSQASQTQAHGVVSAHVRRSNLACCAWLVAVFVVPYWVGTATAPLVLAAGGLIGGLSLARYRGQGGKGFLPLIFGLLLVVGLMLGRGNAVYRFDFLAVGMMGPAAYFLGLRLARHRSAVTMVLRLLVLIVAVGACLGVLELLEQRYVFHGPFLLEEGLRNGSLRARSFFQHPLVFAWFATVCVPLALSRTLFRPVVVRILLVAVLVAGAHATGSRSALAILMVALALAMLLPRLTRARSRVFLITAAVVLGGITVVPSIYGLYSTHASVVTSRDPETASKQFRAELYRNLPAVISRSPSGTGFGAIPEGYLVFETRLGSIDARSTIDSEYVLSAIKFGWLGISVWIVLIARFAKSVRRTPTPINGALMTGLAFGSILAMQSWLSLLCVLGLLLGLQRGLSSQDSPCVAEVAGTDPSST